MEFNTPRQILNAYRGGFQGSICDPEETAELLGKLKTPLFGAAAYKLYGAGEGKLSLPFKSLLKFDPAFGPSEKQTTGDCVAHSTRNAVDITRQNRRRISLKEIKITVSLTPPNIVDFCNGTSL